MSDDANLPGTRLPDIDTLDLPRFLPHRYPFLMIDRVVDLYAFERALGLKYVSNGEYYFQGHFPNDPIMPGVLVVECMAQTSAALISASRNRGGRNDSVYFMAVDEARFRRPVRPGDRLELAVEKERQRLGVWRFRGVAKVDGDTVANAVFSAKVMEQSPR